MRKKAIAAGVAAVVLLGGGGAWLATRTQAKTDDKAAKDETPALQFASQEIVSPRSMPMALTINFSGPLQAPHTATVRSRVAATLLQLDVAEGSRVSAGQKLGSLDLADLNARLLERQAQLDAARVTLAQAERTHASNQRLADQQFISSLALDGSRATLEAAKAQVQVAQAQLETLKVAVREAALVSPINGIVAKRHAVPGEKLAAEQPVLAIVDLRQLEMAGSVGTHEVGMLKPGMVVKMLVEGEADAREARIARISPAAEPGTRAIGVTLALSNPDERLRAGQFATASVQLQGAVARQAVPVTALGVASGQEHVWTLEQGKLSRRVVTTGRRDVSAGMVEVLNGLPDGALVLAARFENLREGQSASVREPGQPGGADLAASTPGPAAPASAASTAAAASAPKAQATDAVKLALR